MIKVAEDDLEYSDDSIWTFDGKPFTGIGVVELPGDGIRETQFESGVEHGGTKVWDSNGILREFLPCFRDTLHGISLRYDANGEIEVAERYEYGVRVSEGVPDSKGCLSWTTVLEEGSPLARVRQKYAEELEWPPISSD